MTTFPTADHDYLPVLTGFTQSDAIFPVDFPSFFFSHEFPHLLPYQALQFAPSDVQPFFGSVNLTRYLLSDAAGLKAKPGADNRAFAVSSPDPFVNPAFAHSPNRFVDRSATRWSPSLPSILGVTIPPKESTRMMSKRHDLPDDSCSDFVTGQVAGRRNPAADCTEERAKNELRSTTFRRKHTQCSDFGTDTCLLHYLSSYQLRTVTSYRATGSEREQLLVELLWLLVSGNQKVTSVLEYLAQAEQGESDVWLRDDLRISWLTCLYAGRGYEKPHIAATQQVLGIHPDKVFEAMTERRRRLLGESVFAADQLPQPDLTVGLLAAMGGSVSRGDFLPPKKPVEAVKPSQAKGRAKGATTR